MLHIALLCAIVLMVGGKNIGITFKYYNFFQGERIVVLITLVFVIIFFTIGIIGYQANFIQLGLDQLLEARSDYLGLFVHYASLAFNFGTLVSIAVVEILISSSTSGHELTKKVLANALPFIITAVSLILLSISCWKCQWFYTQRRQHNPHKTVYGVHSFARKNKYPLRRSVFTYSDNYIPSRIDFAKERYGGPFTTEQVENVKTLLKMLLLLLSLAPIHVLVPASQYFFPLFGYHIGIDNKSKQVWSQFAQNELLNTLSSNILFPVYTWCMYSLCRHRIPKMLARLGTGIVLTLLGSSVC